ncbi:MAG: antibiotic biosynthesis monooxygenase family protein [Mycobacteriales bacterium]
MTQPARSGQIVTVFRSRLRPDAGAQYAEVAGQMEALARGMPGFVDFKTFQAEDGERVSVITFDSRDAQQAWRDHPQHREAQRLGRERFYAEYTIAVSECLHVREFTGRRLSGPGSPARPA